MTRALVVERVAGLVTVQDLGRPGYAHLGVTRSGAADRRALRLANRLVGNPEHAAALEVLLGGLVLTAPDGAVLALAGAVCPVLVDGRAASVNSVLTVPAGGRVEVGVAQAGLRTVLAVRGGLAVTPTLGSRSTDTLAGLGPAALQPGDVLPIDAPGPGAGWPVVDHAPVPGPPLPDEVVVLDAVAGPRASWVEAAALQRFWATTWTVGPDSDRVGLRLLGDPLDRARDAGLPAELPSEGLVRGAVQVPPSGLPVVFGADHPVTGGYPVVAVLRDAACDLAAQLRPGQPVRFRRPGPDQQSRSSAPAAPVRPRPDRQVGRMERGR